MYGALCIILGMGDICECGLKVISSYQFKSSY